MWKVVVDHMVHSYHRTELAADQECARVRRLGRAKWGETIGVAYVVALRTANKNPRRVAGAKIPSRR